MATREGWIKRKANGNGIPWNKGKKAPQQSGINHPLWKGKDVSYSALHHWIKRHLGKPKVCKHCGTTTKRLHWANVSHKYKRDLNDYMALCQSCHEKYDKTDCSRKGENSKLNSMFFNRWTGKWELRKAVA